MTELPKLYPGHQHRWADVDQPVKLADYLEGNSLVACTVCGLEVPRTLANLDGTDSHPLETVDTAVTPDYPTGHE